MNDITTSFGEIHDICSKSWCRALKKFSISYIENIIETYPYIAKITDEIGRTIHHELCLLDSDEASNLLVKLMNNSSLDFLDYFDNDGFAIIHMTAQFNNIPFFNAIKQRSPIHMTQLTIKSHGRNALHFAAQQGHFDLCGTTKYY